MRCRVERHAFVAIIVFAGMHAGLGLVAYGAEGENAPIKGAIEPIEKETAKGGNSSAQSNVDVVVRGRSSDNKRLKDSADAVTVVDTQNARRQTRDLGEVLAGIEGVSVRRTGGLGSATDFSLNGLSGRQVRFFLGGVPLDIAGSPFGIAALPVNLIERIEVYRGVVPVRFGADALGGAVNLVPLALSDSNILVSYQRGSFGTHRAFLSGRYYHPKSGFFLSGTGVFDRSRNDYLIDVLVADKTGREFEKTVRRFHDAYQSYGGTVSLGFLDKRWAKSISLQLFAFDYDKEVQHNLLMTQPIGEAKYGASSMGTTLRWNHDFSPRFSAEVLGSLSRQTITFRDLSKAIYNWYGNKVAERSQPGELDGPHDATIWQNAALGRVFGQWRFRPEQALRLSTTGRYVGRTGTEKAIKSSDGIDFLAGERSVGTFVSGAEWELNAFDMRSKDARASRPLRPDEDARLQNVLALKHYYFNVDAENVKSGFDLASLHTSGFRFGVADSLRFRLHKKVALKASYELATRIPDVEEFFGDSLYIQPNLDLLPETAHNVNFGVRVETRRTPIGNFTVDADGFLREVTNQIVPLASANGVQHENVGGVRVKGVEGSLQWISPGNWVILDGNVTWQDLRNVASTGNLQEYNGERIPNKPWLFGNWRARFQWRKLLAPDDGLAAYVQGRYVHEFFRNWEGIGDRDFKAVIPEQIAHTVGITYWNNNLTRTSVTLEVDNVTDARLYDFFGVQKPGRSVAVKVTGEL